MVRKQRDRAKSMKVKNATRNKKLQGNERISKGLYIFLSEDSFGF